MNKGKLIVIEGLDSSGKETQSRLLCNYLERKGYNVKRVAFPNYDSPSSSLIKMYLGGSFGSSPDAVNAYAASSFFAVDRYATFKTEFEQFLEDGGIVIADRYTTSNMIHQASKIKDSIEKSRFLDWLDEYEYSLLGLPRPDAVFFLDMPLEISTKLMRDRANKIDGSATKDIHESNFSYLTDTYNTAMELKDRFCWTHILCGQNGSPRSVEDINGDIINALGM